MYSPLGVLLEEWCRIDGHDVITMVGVVRNGISVGRVGGQTWSQFRNGIYNIFDPPPE